MEMLEDFGYHTVVHFTGQNLISKIVDCIRDVMICIIGLANSQRKKSNFYVRPWSLLTISNFSERGLKDTTVF